MDGLWERKESIHKTFSRYLARKQCSTLTFRIQHFLYASKRLCGLSGWCDCSPPCPSLCHNATVPCLVLWHVLSQTIPHQGLGQIVPLFCASHHKKNEAQRWGRTEQPSWVCSVTDLWLLCGLISSKAFLGPSCILDMGKSLCTW